MFLSRDELVSTATCRAGAGLDEPTGDILGAADISERIGWALDLTTKLGERMLVAHYKKSDLSKLASGLDAAGKALPAKAYMAGRRLGWACPKAPGVYLPDRFRRTVEEQVVRRLRQSVWLASVVDGLIETWPANPLQRTEVEWGSMWKALPDGVDKATVRNRTRQIATYLAKHSVMPKGLCALEPEVKFGPSLALAAADSQMVTIARTSPTGALLRVRLPQKARPTTMSMWTWVGIPVAIPNHVPPDTKLKTPSLRLVDNRVLVDLPWIQASPPARRSGHPIGLGFDWGVNTFITAAIGYLDDRGDVHSDGKPFAFRVDGASAKVHRLRRQREVLAAKIAQLKKLAGGHPSGSRPRTLLEAKAARYQSEVDAVSSRQTHLNHEIAWAGARWLVDQALANATTVIYAEDLRTMESSGLGRKTNTRVANAVRSELLEALGHLGKRAGIAVVTVPARGTSANCPRCLAKLHHCPSPDRAGESGHKWSICRSCGLSADRDHAAAERIVSRGLAAQEHLVLDRSSGSFDCRNAIDVRVRRTLRPKRAGQGEQRSTHSSSFPRVRLTNSDPATPRPCGLVHQRPAGTHPTGPASSASEVIAMQNLPTQRCRAARYRRTVGRGFHRNAYSTPVVPRPQWTQTRDYLTPTGLRTVA
ncbi:MAG: zinc ribbon domain-containing protein [Candidatus Dormibacteria bacterium]